MAENFHEKKSGSRSAFFNLRILISLVIVFAGVLLALAGFGTFSSALAGSKEDKEPVKSVQEKMARHQENFGVRVIASYRNDISQPLRDAPKLWPPVKQVGEREANLNPKIPHRHVDGADPVVQSKFWKEKIAPSIPGPMLNFDGIPYPGVDCNCTPSDTNGEVGKNHYVQMVNEGYQVFDKATGASILGPNSISFLWAGFGGPCENAGSGDPIVIYDQLADRWIITQFATGAGVPQDECIAVSTTGDPTGSYYRYGFHLSDDFLDYPKLGVWPDAYYMAANIFDIGGAAYLGPQAFAFDRAKMLVGAPVTAVTPGITGGASEETFLPADVDGIIPPSAGAPNPFVQWPSGNPLVYKVYLFHPDFVTPANTTFTLLASPAAAAFTELCPATRDCVPEPNGSSLDAIADRLMFRNAYRKFPDGHDALVNNYTVSSGGVAGVRWFELRNPIGAPVVFQESTYQPDTTWRWLGSVAMDNQGNLALGFSVSSSTVMPGLSYAGRLASDPLNVLAQGEAVLFAGQGSQTGSGSRWGDYSDMTVDPVDDCTFWYTNQYYPSGSTSFNWRTRIGTFKFAQCTPPAKGTAHFVVTTCDGGAPLNGALVSIDGNLYGSTVGGGFYDAVLTPGSHTYSISKPPPYGAVTGNFTIINSQTTNVQRCLVGVPVVVTAGSPLAAESCSPPNGAADPGENVTVDFKLMNNGGASTTNLVATLQNSGGVAPTSGPQIYGSIPPGGMASRSFSFNASGACGSSVTARLQLQDGANNLGTVAFPFNLGGLCGAVPSIYSSGNIMTPLPDQGTANVPIVISDPGAISDINVKVRLNHPHDGDVRLSLVSPGGAVTVPLVTNQGISGDHFGSGATDCSGTPTVFDDSASTAISDGAAPFAGSFRPESPLSAMNGLVTNGTWTLHAADTAGSNSGTIFCVQLEITRQHFVCCGAAGPPQIDPAGSATITAENYFPVNNAPDPGETITATFPLVNNGDGATTNLVATLQNSGGVTPVTTSQTYAGVAACAPPVSRPFTFIANGSCGSIITATLHLQDGPLDLGNVTYTFQLGTNSLTSASFSNPAPVNIPAPGTLGLAAPYPSSILVSGLTGTVFNMTVDLGALNHTFPGDVDMLLVGPGEENLLILSDVIGGNDWTGQSYTLDDAAPALFPAGSGPPASGSFKPTNYGTGDSFTVPAPPNPYNNPATAGSATFASVFKGASPNGTWNLWIIDDGDGDGVSSGTMAGWSLNIITAQPLCAVGAVHAVSRKNHGGTNFDVPLPLAGTPGIECRSGGATNDYTMIITFPVAITVTGSPQAQVTSGTGTIGSGGVSNGGMVTVSGNMATVPLTNLGNAQTIQVTLFGVSDGTNSGDVSVPMGVLVGDVNANGVVSNIDGAAVKGQISSPVTASNFRTDVNANGVISNTDVAATKAQVSTTLP